MRCGALGKEIKCACAAVNVAKCAGLKLHPSLERYAELMP
jgi:hypothetical protein